jgi:hypothetical protein
LKIGFRQPVQIPREETLFCHDSISAFPQTERKSK